MISVGSSLRRKREADGLSVEGIAERLCITPSCVRALEADDVQSLPGKFFYKSFTLQYAAILEVDPESLRAGVESVCERKNEEPSRSGGEDGPPGIAQRIRPAIQIANRTSFSRSGPGLAVSLAVVACAVAGFAVWRNYTPPASDLAEEPLESVEPATPVTPDASNRAAVLSLAAREATWLSITSDGKEIFQGVLWPRQSKTLTLDMARMKVGNAGGLDISWNGRSIGPIGETGQVRVVVLSADDVQVLPPGRSL